MLRLITINVLSNKHFEGLEIDGLVWSYDGHDIRSKDAKTGEVKLPWKRAAWLKRQCVDRVAR